MATSEVVRRALEAVRRVCEDPPAPAAQRRQSPSHQLPAESKLCVRRFEQPHVYLYHLLGRKVRTPAGVGVLWQVFAQRTGVLLDKDAGKIVTYFPTGQVEPASHEL
jgi:hypothetical protein